MVISVIARELLRTGTRLAQRYYALESKAFSKLYTGFPQSRTIGRGVRHGLFAGQIAGSLLNSADDTPGNGILAPFKKSRIRPKASKPYKARGRQPARCPPRRRRF